MNMNLYLIVVKLTKLIYKDIPVVNYLHPYFMLLTKMLKHNGTVYTVKALKTMRLHVTRYLCGQPLLVNDAGVGVDRSGWPKAMAFLKPLADGNVLEKKFLLTILLLSRTLVPKKGEVLEPSWKTIVKPSIAPKEYIIPTGFIKKFVKQFSLEAVRPTFNKSDVYISTKAGPAGPTTLSIMYSILRLSYEQMQWMYNITSSAGVDYFNQLYSYCFPKDFKSLTADRDRLDFTGRLSLVNDPECKVRVIAILDYMSQLFLKPIHKILINKLTNFPCDRTYTQDPHNNWEDNEHSFWSMDLSAATDRFPISVQRRLLEHMFKDPLFAQSWENLLTKRNYALPGDYLTEDGKDSVRYAVGQPMGAYSSWAAFTLSHHLVVHYCAYLEGIHNFDQYIILGDDIVLKHDAIAKRYSKVMGRLGVELSVSKTHVSKDTYEFAKRWFIQGVEVTGLPIKGIVNNIHNTAIVYTSLFDYFVIKKNVYTYSGNLVSLVCEFYKGLKLFQTKTRKRWVSGKPKLVTVTKVYYLSVGRIRSKLEYFAFTLRSCFGLLTYDEMRNRFAIASALNSFYVVPGPGVILSELDRVLDRGLAKVVSGSLRGVMSLYEKIVDKSAMLQVETLNCLRLLPVFNGIKNHIDRVFDVASSWDSKELSLSEVSKNLVQLDIEKIFTLERNKILSIVSIGSVSMKGFRHLGDEMSIIYGSSTTESTYTADRSLSKMVERTLSVLINDINVIDSGTYKVRMNRADAYALWASQGPFPKGS